ncbi:MAG: 5'-deoxynucleotidase [Clostridia bacterium]|nr:5'-deoxynucleotidase [Clostridia bacterium]
MSYNFFAYLNRMKYIERWSLMHSTKKENIMEHSEQVAQLAHALAYVSNKIYGNNVDVNACVTLAVFHESSEVITGDLPTPIKYYNNEIKVAYKELEKVADDKLLSMLPQEMRDDYKKILEPDKNSYEYKLVKAADRLAAYVKCLEEIKSGNKEFSKAEKSIKKELENSPLPEIKYFMDNFIKGFSLTLDELD